MARVSPTRRVERAGVNALRALLEDHNHLVQEIDGGADHGEDLFLMFVRGGRRTGHVVAIQVKSGNKYRRSSGYAIPVADHREDWANSRIPVVGVVYDRDKRRLFWTNLTKEIQRGGESTWVQIPHEAVLNDDTIQGFVAELQQYIDKSGMRIRADGGDLSRSIRAARAGIVIDPTKDGDQPNPLFEGVAAFLLARPNLPRRMRTAVLTLIAVGLMIFDGLISASSLNCTFLR